MLDIILADPFTPDVIILMALLSLVAFAAYLLPTRQVQITLDTWLPEPAQAQAVPKPFDDWWADQEETPAEPQPELVPATRPNAVDRFAYLEL